MRASRGLALLCLALAACNVSTDPRASGADGGKLDGGKLDGGKKDDVEPMMSKDSGAPMHTEMDSGPMKPGYGEVVGRVFRADKLTALAGVTITGPDGITAKSDKLGRFKLSMLPTERIALLANIKGYAQAVEPVTVIAGERSTVEFRLLKISVAADITSDQGGKVRAASGAQVVVDAAAFVGPDGKPVTGMVTVELTVLDPSTPEGLQAFPGDFAATSADGQDGQLESFVPMEITVRQGDAVLDFADGKGADVSFPVPDSLAEKAPPTIALWSLSETTGAWVYEGEAALQTDGTGKLVYVGRIVHMSWWNCDAFINRVTCIRGCVAQDGKPAPYVLTQAEGIDYSSVGQQYADQNGCFSSNVKSGAQLRVRALTDGATSDWKVITAPTTQMYAEQDPSKCQDIGTLELVEEQTSACPPGSGTMCGSTCVDVTSDYDNCGECGHSCFDELKGASCIAGACACAASQTQCEDRRGTACVDLKTDDNHCGACDTRCSPDQRCDAGKCKQATCSTGLTLCDGACVDTNTNSLDCGGCGNACGSGKTCTAGKCVALECPAGSEKCGSECVAPGQCPGTGGTGGSNSDPGSGGSGGSTDTGSGGTGSGGTGAGNAGTGDTGSGGTGSGGVNGGTGGSIDTGSGGVSGGTGGSDNTGSGGISGGTGGSSDPGSGGTGGGGTGGSNDPGSGGTGGGATDAGSGGGGSGGSDTGTGGIGGGTGGSDPGSGGLDGGIGGSGGTGTGGSGGDTGGTGGSDPGTGGSGAVDAGAGGGTGGSSAPDAGNTDPGTCPADSVACLNGQGCVTGPEICDGVPQCSDGSDEAICGVCGDGMFNCIGTQSCISASWVCDGSPDCENGSDESHCGGGPIQCAAGQIACIDATQTPICATTCDSISECGDGSDELGCNTPSCADGQIMCFSTPTCIDKTQICDGVQDCGDGSDEMNCGGSGGDGCPPDMQQCPDKSCIGLNEQCPTMSCMMPMEYCPYTGKCMLPTDCVPAGGGGSCAPGQIACMDATQSPICANVCDGIPECGDGSDELGCSACAQGQLACPGSATCIDKTQLCNGTNDCGDGWDEMNCGGGASCPPDMQQCPGGTCVPIGAPCQSQTCTDPMIYCPYTAGCTLPADCTQGGGGACNPGQVSCLDATQTPICANTCDNVSDCADGSDEDVIMCCSQSGGVVCKGPNGDTCIDASHVCAGDGNQCPDGSDEDPFMCCRQSGQLACADGSACYTPEQNCDGTPDCGDGSDESLVNCGCPNADDMVCANGQQCVPSTSFCDGTPDCADGSDESARICGCPSGQVLCKDGVTCAPTDLDCP